MKCKQNLNNYQQKLTELTARQTGQTKQEMRSEPKSQTSHTSSKDGQDTGSESRAVRGHLCGSRSMEYGIL